MQRILAISWLTWKAALRFRLFLVIALLLVAAVVGLPLLLKDDGTARGFTQIILTYSLSVITALLGISTLWLACGTLARDIEECQMQLVVTKPVARWQIWLGKWIGLVTLDAALLALSGACVFGMLQWRAARLPPAEQKNLRDQVLVARGVAQPPDLTAQIDSQARQILQERLAKNPDLAHSVDLVEVEKEIREQVKAAYQIVPPDGGGRVWRIDLGFARDRLQNKPLQLRIKFNAANGNPSGTFHGLWQVGDPQKMEVWQSEDMSLAPDTYHEFTIPANLVDKNGILTIAFLNVNDTALLFPIEDGIEVLYPEGGFAMNYVRGLGIILCWMALLAAIGLATASFLSFPVAAFCSMAVLAVIMASDTLRETVEVGTITASGTTGANFFLIPMFKVIVFIVSLARSFSPIDSLSTGRAITWGELGAAAGQVVLLLGGIAAIVGMVLFSRRELATAQGNQ